MMGTRNLKLFYCIQARVQLVLWAIQLNRDVHVKLSARYFVHTGLILNIEIEPTQFIK